MGKTFAYIGTWGNDIQGAASGLSSAEGGIKTFQVGDDHQLQQIANVSPEVNAGIICISEDKRFLYATDERKDLHGINGNGGGVCAYKINQADGTLEFINEVSSAGAFPCYISTDHFGRFVYVSNHAHHDEVVTKSVKTENGTYKAVRTFDEGSVGMFPILADGSVGECCDLKVLTGSSVRDFFQWTPHPHSAKVDPSSNFLIVGEKGTDRVIVYRIDYENQKLVEAYEEKAELGCGPRHIAFHPVLPLMYVNSELDSTVHSYSIDAASGKLIHLGVARTIPDPYIPPDPNDMFAENATADIRVHKSGKFLYISNRGHNSIASYALDDSGGMKLIEFTLTKGEVPRAINFDQTGNLLYAVNQRTGNIVQFIVNEEDGTLSDPDYEIQLKNPVCMEFLQLAE